MPSKVRTWKFHEEWAVDSCRVVVRCNIAGEWSVLRSQAGQPAKWARAIGPIGDLVSRVLEGDKSAWLGLATVAFPAISDPLDEQE